MMGFRQFILRGNVVDLAVGVVIGAAFTALTTALGTAFIKPLLAVFLGNPHCVVAVDHPCGAYFTIHGQQFGYGDFVTAIITFLMTAAVLYYFVVRPLNLLMEKFNPPPEPVKPTKECTECLSAIPVLAKKCSFCTSEQPV